MPPNPAAAPSRARAGLVLTLVLAGLAMLGPFSIDTPFPAFGQMRGEFAVGADAMQWVVSAYLFAFAAMAPLHGPLSDALGRKPVILGGLVTYVVASVGCALAPSLPVLLAFRVLQGLSAGAGTIIGRTVIRDLFAGDEAQRLMSRVSMIFGLAPAIAPVLGGWLLALGRWPLVFWFIGFFAAVLAVAVVATIPETHPRADRVPLALAPMARDLARVLRSGPFLLVVGSTSLAFAGQFLYIGGAAIFVLDLLGKGEGDFWMFFVPMISGVVLGSWASGRAAGRVGGRRLVTVGMLLAVAAGVVSAALALAFDNALPYAVLGPALMAFGVALAYPTVQIMLLDMFPAIRGTAASAAAMLPLLLNAIFAALFVPHVTGSVLELSLAALVLCVLGLASWLAHLATSRLQASPPEHPETLEPLEQL